MRIIFPYLSVSGLLPNDRTDNQDSLTQKLKEEKPPFKKRKMRTCAYEKQSLGRRNTYGRNTLFT